LKKSVTGFTAIVILLIAMVLTGCQSTSETLMESATEQTDSSPDVQIADYQISNSIIGSFSVDDNAIPFGQSSSLPDFATGYPDLISIFNSAPIAVAGTVIGEIQYTDDNAIPRTFYSLLVSDVFKGNVEPNSTITIVESNGYVRLSTFVDVYGDDHFGELTQEQIDNEVLLDSLGNAPLPKTGERYVLFLAEPESDGRTANAYAVFGNFRGKYIQNEQSGKYARYCPDGEEYLYTKIADEIEVFEVPLSFSEIKNTLNSLAP